MTAFEILSFDLHLQKREEKHDHKQVFDQICICMIERE